jgi:hypothetical protein
MSQENVEIVRQALLAMDQGLDRVAEFWDRNIDWRAIEGAPDDIGVFEGRAACGATTSIGTRRSTNFAASPRS